MRKDIKNHLSSFLGKVQVIFMNKKILFCFFFFLQGFFISHFYGQRDGFGESLEEPGGDYYVAWYYDADDDGYGNSNRVIWATNPPRGYVFISGDCDDNDPSITGSSYWYRDADGDGYGNPNNRVWNCGKPSGYVKNNQDCDDSNNSINPNNIWYRDADGDGFGNPSFTTRSCIQPSGYVKNNQDCDDFNNSINPNNIWYRDADGDGFGSPSFTTRSCSQPSGYVKNNQDCDDSNNSINPNNIWYKDQDNDGEGTLSVSVTSCTQPSGYVSNNLDCDDTNSSFHSKTIWYKDSNGNGLGDPNLSTQSCTQPSGYVLNNSDPNDTAPDYVGHLFHDTQGNIEVDGGGQLQFTLPIALPPGVKSVAPQVNLVYNSGSGNGIAGFGFNVSGITAISRMGKTVDRDGEQKGIELNNTDYYQFNGQRLVLVSGAYGADGAEYTTEKFSNVKIKSLGALSGLPWQGPEYFEVTFEDGSQAWYGAHSSARTPIEYNITKWKDAQGNYITYNYNLSNNVSSIDYIAWGGNESLNKAHFNEMKFNYVTRDLKETSYVKGQKFFQDKLLTSVVVNNLGKQFKKYAINYKKGDFETNYQFVNEITEYNAKNEAANPIVFEYEKNPGNTGWMSESTQIALDNETQVFGDFDGDGEIDMINYSESKSFCAEYGWEYPQNDHNDPGWEVCLETKTIPEGINYYASVYGQPVSVYSPYGISKEELKNAVAVSYKKDNIISTAQGLATYTKAHDIEIKIHKLDVEKKLSYQYSKTIPNSVYDQTKTENYTYQVFPFNNTDFSMNLSSGRQVTTHVEKMIEADLDGDGMSEAIVRLRDVIHSWEEYIVYDNNPWDSDPMNPAGLYLPEIRTQSNTSTQYRHLVVDITQDSNIYSVLSDVYTKDFFEDKIVGDFDGDGALDYIKTNSFSTSINAAIYSFNKDRVNHKYTIELNKNFHPQGWNNIKYQPFKGKTNKAVVGDFNGDGKSDILVPVEEDGYSWNMYYSMGNSFIEKPTNLNVLYKPELNKEDSGKTYFKRTNIQRNYIAQDINGDGKSDLVVFISKLYYYASSNVKGNTVFLSYVYENKGINSEGSINFEEQNIQELSYQEKDYAYGKLLQNSIDSYIKSYEFENSYEPFANKPLKYFYKRHPALDDYREAWDEYRFKVNELQYPSIARTEIYNKDWISHFSPIVGKFRVNSSSQNIIILGKNKIVKYAHYDFSKTTRIVGITQGGLKTTVEYKELDGNINPGFYASVQKEPYPYMEMEKVSGSYAVSQLRQDKRKQDFLYRGYLVHTQGKGAVGFRQTARSSWYTDDFKNTMVWSGAEIDPHMEGVPVKEWSILTDDINKVFSNISEANTSLLSFKKVEYRKDWLVGGVVKPNLTAAEKPRSVMALLPLKTTTKNFMEDITTVNTLEYDAYYLPTKTVSNVNNGFAISTTDLEYIHNFSGVGKDYYVGRPKSKTEQVQVYGDTKGSKEEYSYSNNLLETVRSYDRNLEDWTEESYQYDGFGNLVQKTISNKKADAPQSIATHYEDKGRFVVKKTDNLGLEAHITYNDWGQILTETDALGNKVTNHYDAWGKLLSREDNLGSKTTYGYQKKELQQERERQYDVIVKETSNTGGEKISYTNYLGQTYKVSTKGFAQNSYISKDTRYDALGRKTGESEPYFEGQQASKWNTIEYDRYSRPIKATSFTGKVMESTYGVSNGQTIVTTTETNANNRFRKQTKDAVGNIISSEDKGGKIEFKYNAAGENLEAKYGQNIVTNKYDAWGRKIEFHDPSNGLYTYEYDGFFGAVSKEISPKGHKSYEYNTKGQLVKQKEISNDGTSTDKEIDLFYNDKGMITRKEGTSKGQVYKSFVSYDQRGRVTASGEESNGKQFFRSDVKYDAYNRITSYKKGLTSSGATTETVIENVYSTWNGALYQLKDQKTQKVLWELNETDAAGNVLKSRLGASTIENSFDTNNFLTSTRHYSEKQPSILQIAYSFNAVKNELNSRTTSGDFNILEEFIYDENNRLVEWSDPRDVTIKKFKNIYDKEGRIIEHDQLGKIKYQNAQSVYRPSEVELNDAGRENLVNNLIQEISYNENNDPIFINGYKGDVRFTYGLTNMRQMATYGGNFTIDGEGKFTKYYSEDGSYEIIKNNLTGKEKHVLYIGGTPYESNILYMKDYDQGIAGAKYIFLHKDYLGSILAVTNEEGERLEQRHYDAWGNLTHLKIGDKPTMATDEEIEAYLKDHELIFNRGYTSHEHFEEVGIIHMNGRLYDPLLRRFLNADENIQDMFNTQNYNKYGYVMNNPLMYNDPNGEVFFLIPLVGAFWSAVIVGAAIGLASYTIGVLVTGGKWNLGQALKSTFFGAVSGAATFGIGQIFSVADATGKITATAFAEALGGAKVLVQGGMHAVSQGVLSLVQGGDFVNAAVSGFLGHLGAEAWGGMMKEMKLNKFAQSTVGMVTSGALSGGIGAELSGGNFWQGATIGGTVALFNSVMHKINSPQENKRDSALMKIMKENDKTKEKYKGWFKSDFIGPTPDIEPDILIRDYGYKIRNECDNCAYYHDKDFFRLKASGIKDALFNFYVTNADTALTICAYKVMSGYYKGAIDRFTNLPISRDTYNAAKAVVAGFGLISSYKNAIVNPGSDPGLYTP